VLGNTGGGRDKWKREEMGKIADKYCDQIILTNEDPYDEDPNEIVEEIKKGIIKKPVEIIMDRRTAINTAIQKALTLKQIQGDKYKVAVLITGKGTDPYIMGQNGSKIPWDDATVAREELKKLLKK
jgi:UDP-N-acetylmuramoyl-L-alanyl-D-glutamate--2,6-diaminopimelate ligase